MKRVRKAIIPAAGLGTRFLPVTKTVPKEMLPIIDRPIILYVVEEAVRAGIEDIVLVTGRGKGAIEDFFDVSYEVEDRLERDGKSAWLESLRLIRSSVNIISLRQKQALGLGHAVLCARPVVGDDAFAVLLGDEIMISTPEQETTTETLSKFYFSTGLATVAAMRVPDADVSKYGIVECDAPTGGDAGSGMRVRKVIEKPLPTQTASRWALPGRYVFSADIFNYLETTRPGKNGEIQLADAMTELANKSGLLATEFSARRFDAGDRLGFLQANIELALDRPELREKMREYIMDLARRL